ncbi:MAG: threonylcarbamoyl-AMP synthase [Prevotellaceae bacterium]|jgi:L-threonylcarbamoyladenylate synthase|nr:threonylcarbamoyl-AMP synthase [Prevotellaceae bacterium]
MTAIVEKAAQTLGAGGLILYPTDTVWGIGCDATDADAVARVLALKRRADDKGFIVLVDSVEMLRRYVTRLPDIVVRFIKGATMPLTFIYPQARNLAGNVPAADGSVAIRVVRHPFCEQLLRAFGKPLVSTSANVSGQPPPDGFDAIAATVRRGCDFIVPLACEGTPTGSPSIIIRLDRYGKLRIMRP